MGVVWMSKDTNIPELGHVKEGRRQRVWKEMETGVRS